MLLTWQEFTAGGRPQGGSIPEDLRDFVENVSPVDRPALSLIRKTRISSTFVEWQSDTLASRGHNAFAEGADFTDQALTTPSRSYAHVQLFARWGKVSDVQRAVEHKGFADAFLYQEKKCIDATLNDIEHTVQRGSAATGATNAARQFAGLLNVASTLELETGIDSSWSGATLTEEKFADAMQAFTDNSVDVKPSAVLVNSWLKRTISMYDTNITRNINAAERAQINVIERHTSDFGDVDIFYSRDQLKAASKSAVGNSIVIFDPTYFEVAFLQPLQSEILARDGLATKFQISAMCTLIYRTEKAIASAEKIAGYIV